MFKPIYLKSENELNKLLKTQRKTGQEVNILFLSLWDKWSLALRKKLDNSKFLMNSKHLYVVNTFDMPHATVIFRSTKLPHLIRVSKRGIMSEDYLPRIYKYLNLGNGTTISRVK